MLNFLAPKTKIRYYNYTQIPIEDFEVIGIGQINPYFRDNYRQFDNEIFVTVVDIIERCKDFDEKEGLVLSDYFTIRRCPRCHKITLIPTKIRLNVNFKKRQNEPETEVLGYCNSCSSCFCFDVKDDDLWLKEARKIKEKELITKEWEKYFID